MWSKKTRGKERDSPGGVQPILFAYYMYVCTLHYSCGDGDQLPQQPPTTMLLLVFYYLRAVWKNIFFNNNAASEFFYFFGRSAGTESRARGIRLQDETHQPAVQVSETSHVCLCLVYVCVNACVPALFFFFCFILYKLSRFFIIPVLKMTILMCFFFASKFEVVTCC